MLVLHQSHPLFLVMVLAGRYMLLFHLPCVQVQAPFCWKHSDITLKGLQDPSLWWQAGYRLWHHVLSCPLSCLFCTWIEFICSGFSFELVSWCLNCFNSTGTLIRSCGVRLVPTMSGNPLVSSLTRTRLLRIWRYNFSSWSFICFRMCMLFHLFGYHVLLDPKYIHLVVKWQHDACL